MRTGDATLVLEFGQVSASRRLGDVELFADFQDGDVSDLGEKFGDGFAAVASVTCFALIPIQGQRNSLC